MAIQVNVLLLGSDDCECDALCMVWTSKRLTHHKPLDHKIQSRTTEILACPRGYRQERSNVRTHVRTHM